MKVIAETTGDFQLVDFGHKDQQLIASHRPSVIEMGNFFQMRVAAGQIRLLGKVDDEATDAEFELYWKESESPELAVSSFLAAFELAELTEKSTPPKAAKPRAK